jgi:uncharacterized glyoxalase superfamily protein PhnB
MQTSPHLHFKGNCREAFWAHRFGMCTDRFGIPWMINCEKPLAEVSRTAGQKA